MAIPPRTCRWSPTKLISVAGNRNRTNNRLLSPQRPKGKVNSVSQAIAKPHRHQCRHTSHHVALTVKLSPRQLAKTRVICHATNTTVSTASPPNHPYVVGLVPTNRKLVNRTTTPAHPVTNCFSIFIRSSPVHKKSRLERLRSQPTIKST